MNPTLKLLISFVLGFIFSFFINSYLASTYCLKEEAKSLCDISSLVLIPTATLIIAILLYLLIPEKNG